MAEITEVVYQRTVNLGNYESEKLMVTIPVDKADDPKEVADEAKRFVLRQLAQA